MPREGLQRVQKGASLTGEGGVAENGTWPGVSGSSGPDGGAACPPHARARPPGRAQEGPSCHRRCGEQPAGGLLPPDPAGPSGTQPRRPWLPRGLPARGEWSKQGARGGGAHVRAHAGQGLSSIGLGTPLAGPRGPRPRPGGQQLHGGTLGAAGRGRPCPPLPLPPPAALRYCPWPT